MIRNGRRVVYSRQFVAGYRRALQQAREDLHAQHFQHLCELADLRHELNATRAAFEELRCLLRANRETAEAEVERLRAIRDAGLTERQWQQRLH
jgi:hypothetical protein